MPRLEKRKAANHQIAAFDIFGLCQCCSAKAETNTLCQELTLDCEYGDSTLNVASRLTVQTRKRDELFVLIRRL